MFTIHNFCLSFYAFFKKCKVIVIVRQSKNLLPIEPKSKSQWAIPIKALSELRKYSDLKTIL